MFSILFWNIWYLNQINEDARYGRLCSELKLLASIHKPDVVALAEAVKPSENTAAPVVKYLQGLGYDHTHSAKMAHINDYWMSGVALCSKFPVIKKEVTVPSSQAVK